MIEERKDKKKRRRRTNEEIDADDATGERLETQQRRSMDRFLGRETATQEGEKIAAEEKAPESETAAEEEGGAGKETGGAGKSAEEDAGEETGAGKSAEEPGQRHRVNVDMPPIVANLDLSMEDDSPKEDNKSTLSITVSVDSVGRQA